MGKPIVVTGAAGFICFHLISRLLKSGRSVIGVDCFDPFYELSIKEKNISDLLRIAEESGAKFHLIRKEFNDLTQNDLEAEAKTISGKPGVSGFIHLGAKAGVRPSLEDPVGYYKANVMGTVNLLEIARLMNVKNFVFASSSSVYGNSSTPPFNENENCDRPISPYASTKRAGELLCATYCHLYGFNIPVLRFFTVFGPRQRPDLAIHKFARLMKKGESITMFGDGSNGRDYTFVEDTVDGIIRAWQWTNDQSGGAYDIFNFGNSKPVPLSEMIREVQDSTGFETEILREPMQPGDVDITWADITHSKEVLGYNPKTPFKDGMKIFAKWFNSL